MRSRGVLSVCLLAAQTVIGQTRVSLKDQGKEADFSGFSSVRPFRTGTTLPASCADGEMFFKTDAPAGGNLYGCVAGSWVQQGAGGGGSPVLSVFGRTGHVTAQAGDYSFSQILGLVSNTQIGAGVDAAKIGSGTVDNTEFSYLDGVTSPIQAQLNSKAAASHTHTAAGDVAGDLASTTVVRIQGRNVSSAAPSDGQALIWNAAGSEWRPATVSSGGAVTSVFGRTGAVTAQTGDYSFAQISGTVADSQIGSGVNATKIGSGAVDNTEFSYLDGVTSPIQAQLNSKAAASHSHTAAGDVTGDLGSTTVARIRGRSVSSVAPTDGQVLAWSAATSEWVPATVGGGGGSGGGAANTPLDVTRSTATDLSVGSNCSLASPCRVRVGSVVYSFTAAATATVTSGGGTAYIYVAGDGTLTVGIPSSGMAVACNGCTAVAGVTAFPADSIPVYEWAASSAQWATTGTDRRSILSAGRRFASGPGIVVSESGNTVTISATGSGGGGGGPAYATVQDEGTSLAQRSTLNFTGGGVTCSDDSGNSRTTCSIPNTAGGDLSGTLSSATVAKIQGRAVASTAPSNGQVLTWNGTSSQWEPQTPPGGGGGGGMPALFTQKMLGYGLPGASSMGLLGLSMNVDGTQSGQGVSAAVPHRAIRYTSGATAGNDAGLTATTNHGIFRRGEVLRVYAGIGSTVNVRWWIALSGLAGGEIASDSPNMHLAGFRYSTSASDTTFKCVTCATTGGGGCTATDSGVAADTNRHLFEVAWTGTAFQFKIDGTTVCTNTTTLPAVDQGYGPVVRLRTLEAASKTLDIGGIYLEKDF
ncbi:MAG TPA: hypothetical protein VNJ11_02405 [Bryobacteraceae bacterium]|nr:hypothetical protein [Bryobacteraceae bacterium]